MQPDAEVDAKENSSHAQIDIGHQLVPTVAEDQITSDNEKELDANDEGLSDNGYDDVPATLEWTLRSLATM